MICAREVLHYADGGPETHYRHFPTVFYCQKPLASPCHKSTSLHVLFLYFRCPAMSHYTHHTQRHSRITPKPLKGAYEVSCRFLRYSSAYSYLWQSRPADKSLQPSKQGQASVCMSDRHITWQGGRWHIDSLRKQVPEVSQRVITASRKSTQTASS